LTLLLKHVGYSSRHKLVFLLVLLCKDLAVTFIFGVLLRSVVVMDLVLENHKTQVSEANTTAF